MNDRHIYVASNDGYDHSRWLSLAFMDQHRVRLELADLCQPGHVSSVERVTLSLDDLEGALRNGAIQVTDDQGYFVLRRFNDLVNLEFRGPLEAAPARASIRHEDLMQRLGQLTHEPVATLR